MDYHEFVCAGTPTMSVATLHADPERIPAAALACCRQWGYSKPFKLGDGTHTLELDAAIKLRVAAEGYYLYPSRPAV